MKKKPLVSIVVLNWNGLENTLACIDSVQALDYRNFELIIVDNGSRREEKDVLEKLDGIIYVDNPKNRGFTGGHIDGLRVSSGEYILLLNNDALLKPNFIDRALRNFEDPDVAAVGGRAYYWNEDFGPYDEDSPYYTYQEIDISTGEARSVQHDSGLVQEVNNVSGSGVLVRRSTIDEIGYLHEPFFAYFEETDLFARMKRKGYKVLYDPSVRIWHKSGASSGGQSYFFYYHIFRNRYIFAIRNFSKKGLRPFLRNYIKIVARSFMNTMRRKKDPMHRAYFLAGMYALANTPKLLLDRGKLKRLLGPSNYNAILFREQNGTSVVVDCHSLSKSNLVKLAKDLRTKQQANIEYVLLTSISGLDTDLDRGVRFVIDKGYFPVHTFNVGCLVSMYNRMVLCKPHHVPSAATVSSINELGYTKNKRVIYKDGVCSIDKSFLKEIGSVGGPGEEVVDNIVRYARVSGDLLWDRSNDIRPPKLTRNEKRAIAKRIDFNKSLIKSRFQLRLDGFLARHYRSLQVYSLIKWLFMLSIPPRIKLGRIRNMLLHSATLNRKELALDIKHSRNEVIIYGKKGIPQLQSAYLEENPLESTAIRAKAIPVFVICYERVESLTKLVDWLESIGLTKIIFIDNDSSYRPLIDYYHASPYQTLRLFRNVGHRSPWDLGIVRALVPEEFYIVTDPDVIPVETCPDSVVSFFLKLHYVYRSYQKVGFGLQLNDIPDHYPLKQSVLEWEKQFWKHELSKNVFEAGVDTTFAMYKPYTYDYFIHPSIRTGAPYVARHLPWYVDEESLSQEEKFYRSRANSAVTSWSASELPERYEHELAKHT